MINNILSSSFPSYNSQYSQNYQQSQPQIQHDKKCIGNNIVQQFCFNKNCQQKNYFLCMTSKCKCRIKHMSCQKGDIQYALSVISKKIIKTDQLKNTVSEIFLSIINKLSKMQEAIILDIDNNLKYKQLTQIQKNVYFYFYNNNLSHQKEDNDKKEQLFNSKKMISLWEIIHKDQINNKEFFERYIQEFEKYKEQSFKKIQNLMKQIQFLKKQAKFQKKIVDFKFSQTLQNGLVKITNRNKTIQNLETRDQKFCLIYGKVEKKGTFIRFKIQTLGTWIGLGLAIKNIILQKKYHFQYKLIGHGSFMISSNGYSWSHINTEQNYKENQFNFKVGDIIKLEVSQFQLLFTNQSMNNKSLKLYINLSQNQWKQACFCVLPYHKGDCVSIQQLKSK